MFNKLAVKRAQILCNLLKNSYKKKLYGSFTFLRMVYTYLSVSLKRWALVRTSKKSSEIFYSRIKLSVVFRMIQITKRGNSHGQDIRNCR